MITMVSFVSVLLFQVRPLWSHFTCPIPYSIQLRQEAKQKSGALVSGTEGQKEGK